MRIYVACLEDGPSDEQPTQNIRRTFFSSSFIPIYSAAAANINCLSKINIVSRDSGNQLFTLYISITILYFSDFFSFNPFGHFECVWYGEKKPKEYLEYFILCVYRFIQMWVDNYGDLFVSLNLYKHIIWKLNFLHAQ